MKDTRRVKMFFDEVYIEPLYRPPSEALSLIIQITVGCSHNKCTFCGMYKGKKFRVKSMERIKEEIDFFRNNVRYAERIFLADGDALILSFDKLKEIISYVNEKFPERIRISMYASPKAIQLKTVEELKALKEMGVTLLYLGVESGSDKVLKEIKKGVTKAEMIEVGKKIKEAGIELSVTAIAGITEKENSLEHAMETAQVISQINPDYFSILSLILEEGTELFEKCMEGKFIPLTNVEILEEIKDIIKNIEVKENCVFRSNHASNYVALKGTLPQDKENLITTIDTALKNKNMKSEMFRRL